TNNGPQTATGVTLTDRVPTGTTLVSALQNGGTPAFTLTAPPVGGTGNIIFSTASMTVGQSAQFTILVQVGASTAPLPSITNTATVSSTTADPNPANNSATASVGTPPGSPTPTPTPVFVQNVVVTPVIPTFQNPGAGAFFNPIAKTPTPRPQAVA